MRTCLLLIFLLLLPPACRATVSTWIGNGTSGYINGSLSNARLYEPVGLFRDKTGTLYLADSRNNRIRKIDPAGNVSLLAGSGTAGFQDGAPTTARFNGSFNLTADDSGNVYVADFSNQRIRKISPAGNVTTIAGSGQEGYADGPALSAKFDYPRGIVLDKSGNLYIGDSWNHRIRKIDLKTNQVTTYAGGGQAMGVQVEGGYLDASDTAASFNTPCGLSIDPDGNIYVADANNHRIRKIDALRRVTTISGSGPVGKVNGGFMNGAFSVARLNTPTEICYTNLGFLLIGDTYNNRVRKLLSDGSLSTLAGNGTAGRVDGADSIAQFNYPRGVAVNSAGDSVFVADFNNHSIRLIRTQVSTGITTPATRRYDSPFEIRIYSVNGKLVYGRQPSSEMRMFPLTRRIRPGN